MGFDTRTVVSVELHFHIIIHTTPTNKSTTQSTTQSAGISYTQVYQVGTHSPLPDRRLSQHLRGLSTGQSVTEALSAKITDHKNTFDHIVRKLGYRVCSKQTYNRVITC